MPTSSPLQSLAYCTKSNIMTKRIAILGMNAILFSIYAALYLHNTKSPLTPPFSTLVAPLSKFISNLSPISSFLLSLPLYALSIILSIKCYGHTALGRTAVGGIVMHFFMQTYWQVATWAGLSRYGFCDEMCIDRVPFGSMFGMLLMNMLEERGWGQSVTWSSLGKAGWGWLMEEVGTAVVFQ